MIVCINDSELLVYKHEDKTQSIQQIPLNDIKYITVISDLLSNSIEVHSDTHSIKVPYNSISESVANKAVELLRDNLFIESSSLKKIEIPPIEEKPSMLINNLLIAEQIYTHSMLLTYEPTTNDVQESATVLNSKELVMITRIKHIKKKKDVDYGYSINYIPLNNITDLEIEASALYTDVMALKINCGTQLIESFVTNHFDFKAFKDIINKSK